MKVNGSINNVVTGIHLLKATGTNDKVLGTKKSITTEITNTLIWLKGLSQNQGQSFFIWKRG